MDYLVPVSCLGTRSLYPRGKMNKVMLRWMAERWREAGPVLLVCILASHHISVKGAPRLYWSVGLGPEAMVRLAFPGEARPQSRGRAVLMTFRVGFISWCRNCSEWVREPAFVSCGLCAHKQLQELFQCLLCNMWFSRTLEQMAWSGLGGVFRELPAEPLHCWHFFLALYKMP